jgi:hypothetical protein
VLRRLPLDRVSELVSSRSNDKTITARIKRKIVPRPGRLKWIILRRLSLSTLTASGAPIQCRSERCSGGECHL